MHLKKLIILVLSAVMLSTSISACKDKDEPAVSEPSIIASPLFIYLSGVRTSLIRKIIMAGVPIEQVRFNSPEELRFLKNPKMGVFHPKGGNAKYALAPQKFLLDGYDGKWHFNGELAIEGLPSPRRTALPPENDVEDQALGEVIAYLPGIKKDLCERINEDLGIAGIPLLQEDQSALYTKNMIDEEAASYILPQGKRPYLASAEFKGQLDGCFGTPDNVYVYFRVLFER